MEEWGNGKANTYYEANVPVSVIRPKEGDAVRVVERYIRDKYEHKKYIGTPVTFPKAAQPEAVKEAPRRQAAPAPAPRVAQPVAASSKSVHAEASLIDFIGDESSTPFHATADIPANHMMQQTVAKQAPQQAAARPQQQQFDSFGSSADDSFGAFGTAPPHATPANEGFGFDAFSAPAPVHQVPVKQVE
jgi:hypothetical protein